MKASKSLSSIASIGLVVATASVATMGAVGCHKSSETEAREAALAAQKAEAKSEHALREVERNDSTPREAANALDESRKADEKAVSEAEDVVEAVVRERRQLSAVLTKEIEWVDNRIGTMARDAQSAAGAVRDEKLRDVDIVKAWRDRLQADLDAVRAADPGTDWSQLKSKIQADLDESRPVQVPHSWEKPYGI